MRTRVRGWRWRRNPLRRRCDVVEAWIVAIVGVLLFIGAPLAGAGAGRWTYDTARTHAAAQRAERHEVRAVLLEDAVPAVPATQGGAQRTFRVLVRWSGPDGATRTGPAQVPAGARRGERADVWLDVRDRTVRPPLSDAAIWQHTLSTGVFTAAATALVVLFAHSAVRRAAVHRRLIEWERDWARTEPEWRRRMA
jgi:hypothetical protein